MSSPDKSSGQEIAGSYRIPIVNHDEDPDWKYEDGEWIYVGKVYSKVIPLARVIQVENGKGAVNGTMVEIKPASEIKSSPSPKVVKDN